jgi:mannose-1-phosphate guanylyltransferase / mannose-6-phosphate isomerase
MKKNHTINNNVFGVIIAGGSGTRLWPLSRELYPKQLLEITKGKTLLQQTAERLLGSIPAENIFTVTHEKHQIEVKKQIKEIYPDLVERVLAEPQGNNTLPAISWGVFEIQKQCKDALIGVFPADHHIPETSSFNEAFQKCLEISQNNFLVTIGIKPSSPDTGYGYIHQGSALPSDEGFTVLSFTEKPNSETAKKYLASNQYYWNSGMFVFKSSIFLSELKKYEPSLFQSFAKIKDSNDHSIFISEYAHNMKNQSIDYGIMEKSDRVAMLPVSFEWNDLGGWEAIYQIGQKDSDGNKVEGNVIPLDTENSLLISRHGLLATIGLKDVVVIKTDDVTLVSARNQVQNVKEIVKQLNKNDSPLTKHHSVVSRPWGQYIVLEEGDGYKIKRITVDPQQKLSLQKHKYRSEHWVVIEGQALVTCEHDVRILERDESTYISAGMKHRLENQSKIPLVIIEIQTGSYLGEDDIERFDDVYGR